MVEGVAKTLHMPRFDFKFIYLLPLIVLCGCQTDRPETREGSPPVGVGATPTPILPIVQVKREDLHVPSEGFELLAGWTVSGDGAPWVQKSKEHAIFGDYCVELGWEMDGARPYVQRLEPPTPLVVNSVFNSVTLWIQDGNLGRSQTIRLFLTDDQGANHQLTFPYEEQGAWQMLHLRLADALEWPVRVTAIEMRGVAGRNGQRTVYLDSLSCYQERLRPIPNDRPFVRPFAYSPPYAPRKSSSVLLDFPTQAAAYRPESGSKRHVTSVTELSSSGFEFRYDGEDGNLAYTVQLPEIGLPTIIPEWNGSTISNAWSGLAVSAETEGMNVRVARIVDDGLQIHYENGLRLKLSLTGKTLQIDLDSVSDQLDELFLGSVNLEPEGRRLIQFPLMRLREAEGWPIVFLADQDGGTFLSIIPDWWRSMAGRYQSGPWNETRVDFGSLVYPSRWKGRRNPLRDRVYLTISPEAEEVLPSLAAPISMFRESCGDRMWGGTAGASPGSELCALGIKNLGVLSPKGDCPSWTECETAQLGSVSPLEDDWDDDLLARSPSGRWLPADDGRFVVKTAHLMQRASATLDPIRSESDLVLMALDLYSSEPPWERTDYDVRVAGAGTFAQVLEDTGALLQQIAAENGGALVGNGGSEWLYAGFFDAFIPSSVGGIGECLPLNPLFCWRNLHPVSSLYGLGSLSQFAQLGERHDESMLLDRAMALQLAYGAMGAVPACKNPAFAARAYFLMQPVHALMTGQGIDRVAFWDGRNYVSTGDAIRSGALERSFLYLRSSSNIEMWINGNLEQSWNVKVAGMQVEIPPFGFVVIGDDVQVFSLAGDEPRDRWYSVASDALHFLDSRERVRSASGMSGQGAAALRTEGEAASLHVMDWSGRWWLSRDVLGREEIGSVEAWDTTGAAIADLRIVPEDGGWWFETPSLLRHLQFQ